MYFKRLELYGFKSFAGKTTLEFEPGITVIVGPNGCGKSNIADSIKWVLGEQNPRELRAAKMEDVIFNGTSLKEPVNFTEVSLTLSNETKIFPIEYEEITVTRRLFRSGESEYLLNKTPVRLKDILELFMGTGIGISAYSLLEQGKIDLILSSKAEDRRFVFEEAAGITKFKSQKREALRRLQDTQNNLLRVGDIITEVARQLASIQRQARKAQRYQELFNIVKEKELKLSKYFYIQLENRKLELAKEAQGLKAQEKAILEEYSSCDTEIKKIRSALEALEQNISFHQTEKINLESSLERNQNKMSLDRERIKELEERIVSLIKEGTELQAKIDADSKLLAECIAQFVDFKNSEETKQSALKDKRELLNILAQQLKEKENLLSSSKVSLMDTMQQISHTKNELTRLKTENLGLTSRLRRLEIEKEKTLSERTKFSEAHNHTKKIFTEKTTDLERLSNQIEQVKAKMSGLTEELKKLTDTSQQLEIESSALSSRIQLLEEMKAHYEGYSLGVKSLMLAQKSGEINLSGIIDCLAELIEVEPGYEQAVETALGNSCQVVLLRDYPTLEACLEYVEKLNLGEIDFMVVGELENTSRNPQVNQSEFVYLKNFVRSSPPGDSVLEYLLGNVILVKDLAQALRLYNQIKDDSLRYVTPKGELIENNIVKTAPLISAGDSQIIGREQRINQLRQKLSCLEKEKIDILNRKNLLSCDLETFRQESISLDQTRHTSEVEVINLGQELENLDQTLRKLTDELHVLDLEITETRGEIQTSNTKIRNCEESLAKLELQELETNRLLDQTNNFLVEKSQLQQTTLIETTQLEAELVSFSERVGLFKERISSLEATLTDEKNRLANTESEMTLARQKIEGVEEEIASLEKDNVCLIQQKETVIKKLEDLHVAKLELKLEISKGELNYEKIQKDLETIRGEIHDLEIREKELDFEMRDLVEKMNLSYKVNLESLDLVREEFNEESARKELVALKEKLEALGPVNLVAIEEERELQERHNFLLNQQTDLHKAKESLLEAIRKIERTTKELFLETFQKIGLNFKEIFRLLFGGGNAQLLLVDDQDILESGIEIIAQPPGKKLQNISLLSGGERALTAVALLFAIFKVKPSPFCILDEVDAPLDEANIDRFRMLLEKFARDSQFIIITHNKKTITIADVMYGITMEESGVSKIVSVKFAEAKAS